MKSHPSEGGEIVLEKGHGTNPEREREDAISFPPYPSPRRLERGKRRPWPSRFYFPFAFPSAVSLVRLCKETGEDC